MEGRLIMELKQEVEISQVSIYCEIVLILINEHKTISLIKLVVFSYLVKKENFLSNTVYNSSNKKNIVNKYLSLLAGDMDKLLVSYEYILKAIHILLKNGFVNFDGVNISKTEKTHREKFVYEEKKFTKKIIEKTKSMSDKQFMREVLTNV